MPGITVLPFRSTTSVSGPASPLTSAVLPTDIILFPWTATASTTGFSSSIVWMSPLRNMIVGSIYLSPEI